MIERKVSEKKVKHCQVCSESVIERVTKSGKKYLVSVYHSQGFHVIIVKNNSEVEHLCLTNGR